MFTQAVESIGLLLFRIATALVALSIAAPELAFAEDAPDYFATHSALSEDHVRALVSQRTCYLNEDTFYGCMEAINTVFFNSDNKLALTNSATKNFPHVGIAVKEIEGLALHKINTAYKPDPKKTDYELALESDQRRKQNQIAWKTLFANTKNNQISIERLLNEAFAQKISKYKGQTLSIAINSFLNSAVDPHTNIHSEKVMQETTNTKGENYSGVGMYIAFNKNAQIEVYPMEGSPALAAGVRKKDILTHIEGKPAPTTREEFADYTNLLRGVENSKVNVTLLRKGQVVNLTITRGKVATKILSGKIITNPKTNQKIGHIRLLSFMQADLCQDFVALAKDLYSKGAESLILDVRGNGGGDLREVLCMASSYIKAKKDLLLLQNPQNNTVTQKILNDPYEMGSGELFTSQPEELYNLYKQKPLVLLQDAGSASASELLPGALQAHQRVITVGERSFGKGTMQQSVPLAAVGLEKIDGILLFMTVARFHFADGSTNQLRGILPDFEVYTNPNPTAEDKYARREADIYTNAIPSGIKSPKGISAQAKAKITSCMTKTSDIPSEFARDERSALGGDYQLITAKAIASCL